MFTYLSTGQCRSTAALFKLDHTWSHVKYQQIVNKLLYAHKWNGIGHWKWINYTLWMTFTNMVRQIRHIACVPLDFISRMYKNGHNSCVLWLPLAGGIGVAAGLAHSFPLSWGWIHRCVQFVKSHWAVFPSSLHSPFVHCAHMHDFRVGFGVLWIDGTYVVNHFPSSVAQLIWNRFTLMPFLGQSSFNAKIKAEAEKRCE